MKACDKLFGGMKMTWPKLIIFSVIVGVLVGLIMICPAFTGNAIREIGVGFEMWIILAVFVVSNCSSTLDAGLKCFIFFLISQPLIYLVQQPFAEINLIKSYYGYWFKWTLLTFPGAMIAYQIKRKDLPGSAIMAIAGAALSVLGVASVINGVTSAGISYVIYGLICIAAALLFGFLFCPSLKLKSVYLGIVAVFVILFYVLIGSKMMVSGTCDYSIGDGHTWMLRDGSFTDSNVSVEGDTIHISFNSRDAAGDFACENELGETKEFIMKIEDKSPVVSEK